jgi:uncharacterized membrane protein
MNIISNNSIKISIIIYLIVVAVFIYLKPSYFYVSKNGKLKTFGTGKNNSKSVFPLWFILIVLAIIIYFLICLIGSHL